MFNFKVTLRRYKTDFLLPIKQEKLFEVVKKEAPKKTKYALNKDTFHKAYPIIDIKDYKGNSLKNITLEKQYTSIFLFNLLLLTKKKVKQLDLKEGVYSEEFILTEIENLIDKDLKHLSLNEIEKIVISFISDNSNKKTTENDSKVAENDNKAEEKKETNQKKSALDNITFSTSWIRQATIELKEQKNNREKEKK